jgi:hypothetical protein
MFFGSHTVTVKCGTVDYLTESLTVKMGGSYNLYIYDKVDKKKQKLKHNFCPGVVVLLIYIMALLEIAYGCCNNAQQYPHILAPPTGQS